MKVNDRMDAVVREMMSLTEEFRIRKFSYEETTVYQEGKTVKTGKAALTLVLEVDITETVRRDGDDGRGR